MVRAARRRPSRPRSCKDPADPPRRPTSPTHLATAAAVLRSHRDNKSKNIILLILIPVRTTVEPQRKCLPSSLVSLAAKFRCPLLSRGCALGMGMGETAEVTSSKNKNNNILILITVATPCPESSSEELRTQASRHGTVGASGRLRGRSAARQPVVGDGVREGGTAVVPFTGQLSHWWHRHRHLRMAYRYPGAAERHVRTSAWRRKTLPGRAPSSARRRHFFRSHRDHSF